MTDDALSMWTVYAKPRDYPGKYVARRFEVGRVVAPAATEDVIVADSLDQLRASLPRGLVCLSRDAHDEPQIVEVWL